MLTSELIFVEAKPKPPCSPELDRYSLMSRCQLARVTNQVRRDSGYGRRPCHSARMSRSSGSATVWRDRELRGATTMASATALKSRTRKPFRKQLHSGKPKSIDPTSILAHILVWATHRVNSVWAHSGRESTVLPRARARAQQAACRSKRTLPS